MPNDKGIGESIFRSHSFGSRHIGGLFLTRLRLIRKAFVMH